MPPRTTAASRRTSVHGKPACTNVTSPNQMLTASKESSDRQVLPTRDMSNCPSAAALRRVRNRQDPVRARVLFRVRRCAEPAGIEKYVLPLLNRGGEWLSARLVDPQVVDGEPDEGSECLAHAKGEKPRSSSPASWQSVEAETARSRAAPRASANWSASGSASLASSPRFREAEVLRRAGWGRRLSVG